MAAGICLRSMSSHVLMGSSRPPSFKMRSQKPMGMVKYPEERKQQTRVVERAQLGRTGKWRDKRIQKQQMQQNNVTRRAPFFRIVIVSDAGQFIVVPATA